MTLRVRSTPEADDQVRAIDNWWRRHRTATPNLFLDELEAAFTRIGHARGVGHPYRQSPIRGNRRMLLSRTRYYVYYVPTEDEVLRPGGLARQTRRWSSASGVTRGVSHLNLMDVINARVAGGT